MIIGYRSKLRDINSRTLNLSQAEIARRTGISRQSINKWMANGVIMKRVDTISAAAIANLYGLNNPLDLVEAVYEEIPGENGQAPELSRLIHSVA